MSSKPTEADGIKFREILRRHQIDIEVEHRTKQAEKKETARIAQRIKLHKITNPPKDHFHGRDDDD
jgi:hypothetical protein